MLPLPAGYSRAGTRRRVGKAAPSSLGGPRAASPPGIPLRGRAPTGRPTPGRRPARGARPPRAPCSAAAREAASPHPGAPGAAAHNGEAGTRPHSPWPRPGLAARLGGSGGPERAEGEEAGTLLRRAAAGSQAATSPGRGPGRRLRPPVVLCGVAGVAARGVQCVRAVLCLGSSPVAAGGAAQGRAVSPRRRGDPYSVTCARAPQRCAL